MKVQMSMRANKVLHSLCYSCDHDTLFTLSSMIWAWHERNHVKWTHWRDMKEINSHERNQVKWNTRNLNEIKSNEHKRHGKKSSQMNTFNRHELKKSSQMNKKRHKRNQVKWTQADSWKKSSQMNTKIDRYIIIGSLCPVNHEGHIGVEQTLSKKYKIFH